MRFTTTSDVSFDNIAYALNEAGIQHCLKGNKELFDIFADDLSQEAAMRTIVLTHINMTDTERDTYTKSRENTEEVNNLLIASDRKLIKAIILALNDGSFIPGSNYTNAQLKAIIKAKL